MINVGQCFPKSTMMFSNVLFSPRAEVIQFTVIEQKTNQKIFTLTKYKSENFDSFIIYADVWSM